MFSCHMENATITNNYNSNNKTSNIYQMAILNLKWS